MKLIRGLFFFLLCAAESRAAALKQAEFTRVINDVKIVPESSAPVPAKVGDTVSGKTAVSTGVQSRAELRYPDKTLTRLGANSIFRMDQGSRTVEVEKGVILLQVPKQLGGAQVRTAAVTAAVTGTTLLVEYTADGHIKIIVIEGEVDVFLNKNRKQFRTLTAGDLWLTRANDSTSLPMPVKIDLKRLLRTSKLMNDSEFPPLGNESQIQDALGAQARLKEQGELMATSFRIEGRGRQVTLLQGERQHVVTGRLPVVPPSPKPPPSPIGNLPSRPPSPEVIEPQPNKPVNVPETTVFDNESTIRTVPSATAFNSEVGAYSPLPGSLYEPAEDSPFNVYMYNNPDVLTSVDPFFEAEDSWFVFKGDEIYLAGDVSVDTTDGPSALVFGSTRDFHFSETTPFGESGISPGNRWTIDEDVTSLAFISLNGSVDFEEFTLTGGGQRLLFQADGPESDVRLAAGEGTSISVPEGSVEVVAGRDIRVDGMEIEADSAQLTAARDIRISSGRLKGRQVTANAGRDLSVGAATASPSLIQASESINLQAQQSLTISNTSQLRRLTEADPLQVSLAAANGTLTVEGGSSIDADTISMLSQLGDVRIDGSTLSAREIKARVLDGGGTLLLSNALLQRAGGNPADLIRLYGEGAGGVRFVGDTTLRGTQVDIAGRTVTIDPGSRVRLSNPTGTTVYADAHNFNNLVNGNFTGTASGQAGARPVEVNKKSYSERPGF